MKEIIKCSEPGCNVAIGEKSIVDGEIHIKLYRKADGRHNREFHEQVIVVKKKETTSFL